jgi:hypothetical protein
MTSLYLYAILPSRPARAVGRGLGGQPLVLVPCGRLVVAAEPMAAPPAIAPAALRRHDAVVRRLGRVAPAALPFRMRTMVESPAALREILTPRMRELAAALRLITGRDQMTVRLYDMGPTARKPARAVATAPERRAAGPGARYLAARLPRRVDTIPGYPSLRRGLDGFVRAERVEGSLSPPLLASLYHLVERRERSAYARALRAAARLVPGVRIRLSGPWAPYAFAPENAV